MRGLVTLVVVLGVLIVVGVAVIVATIVHRMNAAAGPEASVVLDEPSGTHIVAATESAGRLAAVLQGGGPDRVVILDLATGRRLGRVALAH